MAVEGTIKDALEVLLDEIRNSNQYMNFENRKKEVLRNPDLLNQVKRTRVIREQLSRMNEGEKNGDFAERLEDEYDNLCDLTGVHEFSLAELELCVLYQEILGRLVEEFEVDLD